MLRMLRHSQRWFIALVVGLIAGAFVFVLGIGGGALGPAAPGVVLRVAERSYTPRDLFRLVNNLDEQQREALGDDYDAEAARPGLERYAAESLIRRALLAHEAEQLGLEASREEIRETLRRLPGLSDETGRLDRPQLESWAGQTYGSLARAVDEIRDGLLALKMERLIHNSVAVSKAESEASVRYQRETVRFAALLIDGNASDDGVEVSEEAVQQLVTEEALLLQQQYDARIAEFEVPEQLQARHILLRLAEDADDATRAETRRRIEAARARIEAGEPFAEVAKEVSEDASSAQGGDLGRFGRGAMVAPFEQAAFALETGQLSEVVETAFGLHLIQLDERFPASVTSFAEAREGIARDVLRERIGRENARLRAAEIGRVTASGRTLIAVARERGLTLLRPSPVSRNRDGLIPELGLAPALLDAAFAGPIGAQPEVHEIRDGVFVLIEVLERSAPSAEELQAEIAVERARLLEARRDEARELWLATRRRQLEDAGQIALDLQALR